MSAEALDLIRRYDRLSRNLERQAIARLGSAIEASYRELEREFLRQYPRIQSEGSLLAMQRRAVLMNDLNAVLQVIRPEMGAEYQQVFNRMIVAAGELGGDMAAALMRAIAPDSFVRVFAGINLEAAALQAKDAARRLSRYNDGFRNKASAIVEQALIQGWGARRVADALRKEMAIAKYNAERIARTEVMAALNDAAQMRYQQSGVEGVQWVATIGEACPYCVARNMQVYQVGAVRVPGHPFCRCVLIPWSREWQEMGLADADFSQKYRDERIADLKKEGREPNYGPTPFERIAGLDKPPESIWRPGQQRRPTPPPAPNPQTSRLQPDHVITSVERWQGDAIDRGLDLLSNEGAVERVEQFREFVRLADTQAIFYDASKPWSEQQLRIRSSLKVYDPNWTEDDWIYHTKHDRLGGFTIPSDNHVVLATNYNASDVARRALDIDAIALNRAVRRVIDANTPDDAPWAIASATVSGTDAHDLIVYLHEMGHRVHNTAGLPGTPREVQTSLTVYGDTNKFEWYAEHFAAWMIDARAFAAVDPEAAKFVEETFNEARRRVRP